MTIQSTVSARLKSCPDAMPVGALEVSVIVPARNEEACLANCLRSLVGQRDGRSISHPFPKDGKGWGTQQLPPSHPLPNEEKGEGTHFEFEIIVVDDHSSDGTRTIAESFPVTVTDAEELPAGWSGKCNACWSGAKVAKGKWLLFTDADTTHTTNSIAQGLSEAEQTGAALLSYSPKQEVHSFAERALMPVIFAELAATFRPGEVSDPNSPAAAANGQYLLIRRDAYDHIGGHAAVAKAILEDVELARLVKRAGYRLQFRLSDAVSTRMYRSFGQMWEGWTKNLALLFPRPLWLAAKRALEFVLIVGFVAGVFVAWSDRDRAALAINGIGAVVIGVPFLRRIVCAHFDWVSNCVAVFGLPLFSLLLVNSYISHKNGKLMWKGRVYGPEDVLTTEDTERTKKD